MNIKIDDKGNKYWKPNSPKQETFVSLPDTIFEALYGGAAGGGKSEIILAYPIARGWYEHPKFHGIIFRRSFPQLDESLIPRSKDAYPFFGGIYNEAKHFWKFPSGATIRFGYLDSYADCSKHDTAEYNYIGFDELTHFEEQMYTYLISRCRTSVAGLPSVIRAASNPGNIGHSWVRARFVEPFVLGNRIIEEVLKTGRSTKRIFIPAKLTDNPDLMDTNPEYFDRLHLMNEADRKAKLDGDWWAFTGQVFTEFRAFKYNDEPEHALHVIKPFEIPEWWPKLIAIDWGYTHKTWIGWGAVSPDGRLYLYREYVVKEQPISKWATECAKLSILDRNIVAVEIDPSANKSDGFERTIKEQFTEFSGFQANDADNDRVGGKMLIHEMLRWDKKPEVKKPAEGYTQETADRILRMYGKEAWTDYQELFEPEKPELNLPKLQIFNTCKEIINVLPTCVYDETREEDVKKFDGDDSYDGLRYLCKTYERYINDAKIEQIKRERVSNIVHKFESTGDYTVLHRQMEKLESNHESQKFLVFRRKPAGQNHYRRLA